MQADAEICRQRDIGHALDRPGLQRKRRNVFYLRAVAVDRDVERAAGGRAQVRHRKAQIQRASREAVVRGFSLPLRRGHDQFPGGPGLFVEGRHGQVDVGVRRHESEGANGFQRAVCPVIVCAVPAHPLVGYQAIVENDFPGFGIVSVPGHGVALDQDHDRTTRVDFLPVVFECELASRDVDLTDLGGLPVQIVPLVPEIEVQPVKTGCIFVLDCPLDPGRFIRDGKRLVVIHDYFQHF